MQQGVWAEAKPLAPMGTSACYPVAPLLVFLSSQVKVQGIISDTPSTASNTLDFTCPAAGCASRRHVRL